MPGSSQQACGELSAEDLADYPAAAAPGIERAIWAARIKAERLLPLYPQRADQDDAASKAGGMLAAMRARRQATRPMNQKGRQR